MRIDHVASWESYGKRSPETLARAIGNLRIFEKKIQEYRLFLEDVDAEAFYTIETDDGWYLLKLHHSTMWNDYPQLNFEVMASENGVYGLVKINARQWPDMKKVPVNKLPLFIGGQFLHENLQEAFAEV